MARLPKVSDYFARIFERPAGERSMESIKAILPIIMMKTACLKTLDKDTVVYILQQAMHIRAKEDDILVKQGDTGDTFYIILTGSVSILLDTKLDEKGSIIPDDKSSKPPSRRRVSVRMSVREDDDDKHDRPEEVSSRPATVQRSAHSRRGKRKSAATADKSEKKDDSKRFRKKFGFCINTMGRYDSFGELALIHSNRKRLATVIVDEPADILAIPCDIFQETLQESVERDLEEKRHFISNHPFFSSWQSMSQRQLQWAISRTDHKHGDHVIKQGEPVSGLHFLHRGRARLAAEPLKHRQQFSELFLKPKPRPITLENREPEMPTLEREDSTLSEVVDNLRSTKRRHHLLASIDPLTYIRRMDGYAAAERVVFEKSLDVCTIEEGEVICDCELLLGMERNIFDVVCTSACTLYHIDLKAFDRLISKRNPQSLSMVKMLAEAKLKRRSLSPQGLRVPVLAPLLFKVQNVRIVDPFAEEETAQEENTALAQSKPDLIPKQTTLPKLDRSATVLLEWFIQGRTPIIQPIARDAVYQRYMVEKRAKIRDTVRQRGPVEDREVRSLARRIKDTYWSNIRAKRKALNMMKRLQLQNSEMTPVTRWK